MAFAPVLVVGVLIGAAALFVSGRYRLDVVGFLVLVVLVLTRVLTLEEALAGFSDPTVLLIGGLFVVGGAFFRTGLADRFGQTIERLGRGSRHKLLLTVLLATSLLSAFLSSTGTVALMVPVVTTLCRRSNTSPSKVLIPLAFATLLGGLLTLIATAPNIVVSTALEHAGYEPFHFFSFTGPGLCLTGVGITFLVFFGDRFLPERVAAARTTEAETAHELWHRYGLEGWLFELRILPDSPLIGRTIAENRVRSEFGVAIFSVREGPLATSVRPPAEQRLAEGQILVVKGAPERVTDFCGRARLEIESRPDELPAGLVVAELLVPPTSSLVGQSIIDARLRSRYDVTVMGVFRTDGVLRDSVAQTVVHTGDLLLVVGSGKSLMKVRDELPDAIVITESEALKKAAFRTERAPHTLVVLLLMLVAMGTNIVPPVIAVLAAALLLVMLGCIDGASAERSIQLESLLLIATILPLATALQKVGVIDAAAGGLARSVGDYGGYALLAALFVFTALVGTFISNTATAVLMAPIAIQVAKATSVAPHPLLMGVAIAASAAFLTPVSSPVNLLVVNAGGYRFGDFARIGVPLLVLTLAVTLLVVPLFFPFAP